MGRRRKKPSVRIRLDGMPYGKPGRKPGSQPPKESPFCIQVICKISEKQDEEMRRCVRLAGIPKSQWIREAINDRISLTLNHSVPTGRLIDVPVCAERPNKRRAESSPITLSGIRASAGLHSAATFIEKFIDVCSRHPKLNRSLKRTKDTKIIYFDSFAIEELVEQMNDPFWDAGTLLKALDTLDFYNGGAEWGVASLDWLMTRKRKVGFGWRRLLNNYLSKVDATPEKVPVTLEKCKPIATWIAKGQNLVEGSHEAQRILDYVYEKCLARGYDTVRDAAIQHGAGPDGWKNFKRSFRDG